MYKVSSHSNHILKTGRPRTFPIGAANSIESSTKRSTSNDGSSSRSGSSVASPEMMTSPKPIFKKSPSKQNYQNGQSSPHVSQSHEEMMRFVHSNWQQVMQEYETAQAQGNDKVVYYDTIVGNNNNNVLADFKPFDLEKWFVQRMLRTMDIDASIAA